MAEWEQMPKPVIWPRPETVASADASKTYLKVPFAEKDEAKGFGARWDQERKMWYVPAGMDISVFRRCNIQCNMRVYVKEMFGHTLELDVEESCIVGQDLVQGAVQCAHHPSTC